MAFVELKNLKKNFGQTQVLRGIELTIEKAEHVVIRGASGSGKSTLLYLLGGLDTASSGEVLVNGKNLSRLSDEELSLYRNREVGFVFQFHYLLPSMSALSNILLPARIAGADLSIVEKEVKELARELGVLPLLNKYPFELSGGEQQRVNLIRALSLHPQLLLCDEPTGNLDSANSQKVVHLLRELAKKYSATLVVVTHDETVARAIGKEIIMVDGLIHTPG